MIINDEYFGQVINGTKKANQFDIVSGSSNEITTASDDADCIEETGVTIYAGAGNDTINVNDGNNHYIFGGSGNDTINIYNGSGHAIYGGSGNDSFNIWWKSGMEITINQQDASAKDNDKLTIYDVPSSDFNLCFENNNLILKNLNGEQINLANINVAGFSQLYFAEDGKNYMLITSGSKAKLYGRSDSGDEVYIMGASKHTVYTYDGNDIIHVSGGSSHTIKAGNDNDRIILSGGSSIKAYGESGEDYLEICGGYNQTISGGNESDQLYINDGYSHKAYGDNGEDYLEVNVGSNHQVYGGNDNDIIVINTQGEKITAKGENGNDRIFVNAGTNHYISGGNGDDYIEVKSNGNRVYGDNNDDTILIEASNNTVDSGKNNDTITLVSGAYNNIKTSDGDDKVELFGGSNNTIDTGKHNDTVTLNDGSFNTIKTADGNDTVNINGGSNNTIDTGKNNDSVTINAGDFNTLYTVDGNDSININGGSNNTFYAGKGSDTVVINGGNLNNIYTENDNDKVYVNGGNNSINLGAGNDYIQINSGFNVVYGGAGNDTFDVFGGENYVYGESGNDTFNIQGNAFVKGGAGSDVYNVTWNENLDLTIVQSENGSKDKDVLNITNLNSSDVRFGYNDKNELVISGKNGGQTTVSSYSSTIFNYIQFADGVRLNTQQIQTEAAKVWSLKVGFQDSGNVDIYIGKDVEEIKLDDIKAANVSYTYDYYQDSLIITNEQGATATIKNWSTTPDVELKFADASISKSDIAALATMQYSFDGNNSIISGTNKADIVKISGSSNKVYGEAGNDSIEVSGSDNQIYGGEGNDVINISGTNHVVNGGLGNDQYSINWTLGSSITIDNKDFASGDADRLNISNYSISDFTKSYDELTGAYTLTDELGGKLVINGWKENSMEVTFKGENYTAEQLNEFAKPKVEIPKSVEPENPEPDTPEGNDPIIPENKEPEVSGNLESNLSDGEPEELSNNILVISDNEETVDNPIEITRVINGTDGDDVFDIVADISNGVKVTGGTGKDTYNIAWTHGAHVVIDQTSNGNDKDLLNITGLNYSDVFIYLDDYTNTLSIKDKFGGSIDIVGWSRNYIYNTTLDDKKLLYTDVYNNMWYGYNPKCDKGSINIIDKVIVDYECDRNRTFTITTDDEDLGKVVVNMTKVAGIVEYDYNLTKKDFGIVLTNNKGTDAETVVSLTLANISSSSFESLNIGSAKSFYFVKNGVMDFTAKEMAAENEIIFTGVNTKNLDVAKWNAIVNVGQATLNFNQLQMLAENIVKTDSNGNLVNVKASLMIDGVKSGDDLILTYFDTYKENERKVGEVTLKDFYNNGEVNQNVYMGRTCQNDTYSNLRLVVGSELNDTVNMGNFNGNIMYFAGSGNDSIVAKAGSYIVAQEGDDTIISLGDYVDILGGEGDDIIKLGDINKAEVEFNVVDAGIGNDYVSVYGNHNGVRSSFGDDVIVIEKGDYNTVYAEEGNDAVTINGNNNYAYGEDGNDSILIEAGDNNLVYGGNDDDLITLNDGTKNRLYGDYGTDTIVINGGSSNQAYGGEGNDYLEITGGTGNKLQGGTGDDVLTISGGSKNYAYGDAGEDCIIISGGEYNYAYGRDNDDCIKILGGNKNSANGDNGNDQIYVYSGTGHTVHGGAGDDMIYIDGGDNREVGTVTAYGDAGNDIFVVESTSQGINLIGGLGSDVYDVDWTLGDKLVVRNGDYATGDVDLLSLNDVNGSDFDISYNETTGVLLLTDSANGTIKIEGYSKNPLEIKCNGETLDTTAITKMMWNLNTASYEFNSCGIDYSEMASVNSMASSYNESYVYSSAQAC